jgi:hypothetical protein
MAKKIDFNRRKFPKQTRSAATVTALLDATAQVLVKLGFPKASTNTIAEVAGVSYRERGNNYRIPIEFGVAC